VSGGDTPSPASQRGLDWFNFFVANVQTGFGPFVAVYLASEAWTQGQIGISLSIGTVASIASQLPGGALVDAMRNKKVAAFISCVALIGAALLLAFWPKIVLAVWLSEVMHGFASSMLSPAIAAMSLALVGRAGLGERLGRNSRYAAVGSGVAAALMGASGTYVSEASVFYLTAALMIPSLMILRRTAIPPVPDYVPAQPRPQPSDLAFPASLPAPAPHIAANEIRRLITDRRVLVFGLSVMLFHLANAAQLPLVAGDVTARWGSMASLIIAACIVLPQLIVALFAPAVGRWADHWGRRPVLIFCFLALPARAVLLAVVDEPLPLILVQGLDGISAAGFGVLLPLVTADVTQGTNRFNLCLGAFGLVGAFGATLSTTAAGIIADFYGNDAALLALAAAGLGAVLAVALAMPETRPEPEPPLPGEAPLAEAPAPVQGPPQEGASAHAAPGEYPAQEGALPKENRASDSQGLPYRTPARRSRPPLSSPPRLQRGRNPDRAAPLSANAERNAWTSTPPSGASATSPTPR